MEKYRKIPSLDFRYEVSKSGVVRNVKSKKIVVQNITANAYMYATYKVNKTNPLYPRTTKLLHQIVMECWGGKQPSKEHSIDHIDCDTRNNNISNLRWKKP